MDVVLAVGVLLVLGAVIVGVVRWARGGAAYDDGTAPLYVPYVPEPGTETDGGDGGGGD